jgi:CheY-like chemotaxis protein
MRRILVPDDAMVCAATEFCLQHRGLEVVDGDDAYLGRLEASTFNVMLVDIFMPHLRDFESMRIFHQRAPVIPLVAMSGDAFADITSPSPDLLSMASEAGAAR